MTSLTLLLNRSEVAALFTLEDYIVAVEAAFKALAEGHALTPALLQVNAVGGEFHVKAGGLTIGGRTYFGVKANGGFFSNPSRGMPAIQGIIYIADAGNGAPLAILDSIHITIQRTGAATAVAAKYLARTDASVATICGAGKQGRIQLASVARVRRLSRAYVWDLQPAATQVFAQEMTVALGIPVTPVADLAEGTRQSDIVVTCTPAKGAFLAPDDLRAGTFVAAVGADSPDKQELDPRILAQATVVTDVTAQCALVGELHHAIAGGLMRETDVHAELGDIIAGHKAGRRDGDDLIVYDATGTALQDTACATAIYLRAVEQGRGMSIQLA